MNKMALLFVFVQSLVFANDPVITLNGDSVIEIYMGSTFVDPGATAYDEEDGVITNSIQVSGSVDTNTHGTYVLAYNVTDSDGNSATVVVRTINVVDDARPSHELTINASLSGDDDVPDVGDIITYELILSNTGNTDFFDYGFYNGIYLTDFNGNSKALTTPITFSFSTYNISNTSSIPGEQHFYIATYIVTQQALDSGGLTLQLNAYGLYQNGDIYSSTATNEFVFGTSSDEIILDGQISANNNQIKKVADPTDNLDAVNKRYVDQRTLEQTIPGQNIGDLLYWNGQSWQKLSAPQEQSTLRFCEGQLTWGPCKSELYLIKEDSGSRSVYFTINTELRGFIPIQTGVLISSLNPTPNFNDTIINSDNDQDNFHFSVDDQVYVSGLEPNTTYFIRAFAQHNDVLGTSFSKTLTFKTLSVDQNGNTIYSKTYGNQEWSTRNANVTTYRDGTPIPEVTDPGEWANLTTGAWCYPNNQDQGTGKLYNWYAVAGINDNDPNTPTKEFAPEGWHVPTDAEWTTLENYLIANGYNYDGTTTGNKIAKAMASKNGWNSSTNTGSIGNDQSLNNSSGFNAFPEGYRHSFGSFVSGGSNAVFWSSTESDTGNAWNRNLNSSVSNLNRGSTSNLYGLSVRFVKD